jgi:hypothetical protein
LLLYQTHGFFASASIGMQETGEPGLGQQSLSVSPVVHDDQTSVSVWSAVLTGHCIATDCRLEQDIWRRRKSFVILFGRANI